MKAIQFFAIAALGAALFASCSSEEELAQSNYPMDNVVRIMTSVDDMNTKHSHPHFTGNDKGLICHDEKVAYLTFEGRKEAKKTVKTTFLQKK